MTSNRFVLELNTTPLSIVTASSQLVAAIYPAPCESGAVTVINVAAKTPPIPNIVKKIIITRSRLENNSIVFALRPARLKIGPWKSLVAPLYRAVAIFLIRIILNYPDRS